jgi:two-component system phosphate regulon sensor histidine kinase PhoR
MVGRALANLIHNAIKFTDQGGVTVSAEISDDTVALAPGGDGEPWVTVSVRDSGVGLPPAEISRIFERFYKIDRSRKQSGTGLGLAIAKHIVEGHGGRIWAHNNPKAGVTFSFSLPGEG